MARDETIAPLVNLIPNDTPGDSYAYVAKVVWEYLEKLYEKVPQETKDRFDEIFSTAIQLQKEYDEAPQGSETKVAAFHKLQEWRNHNRKIREDLFSVYWMGITDPKQRRAICKRPTLSLSYGGTPHGMATQVQDDTADLSDYLKHQERLWSALLGRLLYDTCYTALPGPAQVLTLAKELAARAAEKNEYLEWTVPSTNFPVIQTYKKPIQKRTKLTYGDDELKVIIQVWDERKVDASAQKTGAAPNLVHSFDAAHLINTVVSAPYSVAVVHDSFGCHAGSMEDLFHRVRNEFVKFYELDPLGVILKELNAEDLKPSMGSLDISLIKQSDYAFC